MNIEMKNYYKQITSLLPEKNQVIKMIKFLEQNQNVTMTEIITKAEEIKNNKKAKD